MAYCVWLLTNEMLFDGDSCSQNIESVLPHHIQLLLHSFTLNWPWVDLSLLEIGSAKRILKNHICHFKRIYSCIAMVLHKAIVQHNIKILSECIHIFKKQCVFLRTITIVWTKLNILQNIFFYVSQKSYRFGIGWENNVSHIFSESRGSFYSKAIY